MSSTLAKKLKVFAEVSLLDDVSRFTQSDISLSSTRILETRENITEGILDIVVSQIDAPLVKDLIFYVTRLRGEFVLFGFDNEGYLRSFMETDVERHYKSKGNSPNQKVEVTNVIRVMEPIDIDANDSFTCSDCRQLDSEILTLYWDEISHMTDDPYISHSDLENQHLRFKNEISIQEFESLIETLLVATGKDDEGEPLFMRIEAATDEEPVSLNRYDYCSSLTPWGSRILDEILHFYQPSGWSWEYNDGAHDRRSGYDMTPIGIEVGVEPPSALERAAAAQSLLNWIDETLRKHNADLATQLINDWNKNDGNLVV